MKDAITIEELKKDNPNIDYDSMTPGDLEIYKLMYMDSLALQKATQESVAEYNINDFNTNFLAYFSGSPNLTEENNIVLGQMWMQVAGGTGCIPVNIIDENHNVLFTIPPMYSTEVFRTSDDGSIGKLLADYKLEKERSPMAGEKLVNNMLGFLESKTGRVDNDPWESFKVYYGLYDNVKSGNNDQSGESFDLFN